MSFQPIGSNRIGTFSLRGLGLLALLALLAPSVTHADDETGKEKVGAEKQELDTLVPKTIEDLRNLQTRVKAVLKQVVPATVGLRVGGASGSGVIISKDGYVLTAGHVSGAPNRNCTVILPNGRQVRGKTLGANRGIDSGLIKITDEGEWPFIEMGKSEDLENGQWCIAVGHPGGFERGRTPVVRLGRVQRVSSSTIQTDCALVGGDSGGPLFSLAGKVVGIHSRIGGNIAFNIHVPVDTYRETWDRLADAEVWGGRVFGETNVPYMGVTGDKTADSCRLSDVTPDSPAERAGLKAADVILEFDGVKLEKYSDLRPALRKKKIGDKIPLLVLRDGKKVELELKLGRRE